jgi:hypothetical protein
MDRSGRAIGEVDFECPGYEGTFTYLADPEEGILFKRLVLAVTEWTELASPDMPDPEKGIQVQRLVFAATGSTDLASPVMRQVPLGAIRLYLRSTLEERPELHSYGALFRHHGAEPGSEEERRLLDDAYRRAKRAARSLQKAKPRRTRGVADPDRYRRVAQMYLGFCPKHGQRVIQAMTEELRKDPKYLDLSRETVSTWVRRARDTGWLTPSSRGKAGGDRGPKMIEWDKKHEKEQTR